MATAGEEAVQAPPVGPAEESNNDAGQVRPTDTQLEPENPEDLSSEAPDDSALGSDSSSTRSASLTSSIIGYKYENGRRYHAYREGAYYLPNDEAEQDRLDLIHHIWKLAQGGGLLATQPPEKIERVLDFGTGTGIWAIDLADEYPDAEVVGTDLSAIQPSWVPPNLKFYVDDVEDEWTYRPDEAFDLIHGRGMVGAIADWKRLFRRIRQNLRPGGLLEMQEYEGSLFSSKDISKTQVDYWQGLGNKASSQFGKELNVARQLKGWMEETGFVDVKEKIVKIPIGTWAKGKRNKEMGVFQMEHICHCVDSYTPALFGRVLGWSQPECAVIMAKVKTEVRDQQWQLYSNFFFVSGRAPAE